MARSLKKGPYVEERLMNKIESMNERREKVYQDMVPPLHHFSGDGRAYHRRPRRPQAYPDLY